MICRFLLLVVACVCSCLAQDIPSCDNIPLLQCCHGRFLSQCFVRCADHVAVNCPNVLNVLDTPDHDQTASKIPDQMVPSNPAITKPNNPHVTVKPRPQGEHIATVNNAPWSPRPVETRGSAGFRDASNSGKLRESENPARQTPVTENPRLYSPPPIDVLVANPRIWHEIPETNENQNIQRPQHRADAVPTMTTKPTIEEPSKPSPSKQKSRHRVRYPFVIAKEDKQSSACGTKSSHPPYSPCLPRKIVDELFLSCCEQHTPPNCHSICTYEDREKIASQLLISAVQQDRCDLRYLSAILHCANRNRDNRRCCERLGLADRELRVGDRCIRMCNIGTSGDRVTILQRNDLVCLSNWNVIMYCARAGLRTIG